eukprot:c24949_g1_i1 orf=67-1782(+)
MVVAFALDSRASIATASPLSSSFLPKCTHLLQAQFPHHPPTRLSFHGVVASTKQKKKARTSSSAREWSYEHLMVLWDEVFEQCCTDPVKATRIRDLSYRGLSKHGRGCVLVFQEVQTRPRGSGTGFTSKPPRSSRRVPDFVTIDWYAVYLPREFLLDPRKAPNEAEIVPPDEKEFSDDASHMVETRQDVDCKVKMHRVDSQDVTIDVEDIIRNAQDVYRFDSDDDELDSNAEDVGSNGDSLLVGAAARRNVSDSLLILDDDDDSVNDVAMAASVSYEEYEAPLLIFDDDEAPVTSPPRVETQNNEEASADGARFASANVGVQAQYDGAADIACDILIEREEEGRIVDDMHSSCFRSMAGRAETQSKKEGSANATSVLYEANAPTVEFLEDGTGKAEMQFNRDGGDNDAHNASGLDATRGSTVELLEESVKVNKLNGSVANEKAFMGSQGANSQGDRQSEEDDDVQLVSQQMLFTSMRGIDMTRLMSLTANFDFEAERFRFRRKTAMIDTKTMDAGGEDPYNPKEDELVMLLHLVTDGRPAYGADVVIAYRDEPDIVGFEKDSWKLKGKYKV